MISLDKLEEKSIKQLSGRLGYIIKVCRNECDIDCWGICPFVSEANLIREELSKRKNNS